VTCPSQAVVNNNNNNNNHAHCLNNEFQLDRNVLKLIKELVKNKSSTEIMILLNQKNSKEIQNT